MPILPESTNEKDLKEQADELNVTPGFIKYLVYNSKRKSKRRSIREKPMSLPAKRVCRSVGSVGEPSKDIADNADKSTRRSRRKLARKRVSYNEADSSEDVEEYFDFRCKNLSDEDKGLEDFREKSRNTKLNDFSKNSKQGDNPTMK